MAEEIKEEKTQAEEIEEIERKKAGKNSKNNEKEDSKDKEDKIEVKVDDHLYTLDMLEVEKGAYSILKDGVSYNLELLQKANAKQYEVHTHNESFDIEIIDAESKYFNARLRGRQW